MNKRKTKKEIILWMKEKYSDPKNRGIRPETSNCVYVVKTDLGNKHCAIGSMMRDEVLLIIEKFHFNTSVSHICDGFVNRMIIAKDKQELTLEEIDDICRTLYFNNFKQVEIFSKIYIHSIENDFRIDRVLKEEFRGHRQEFYSDLQKWHDNNLNFDDNSISKRGETVILNFIKNYTDNEETETSN